MEKKKKIAKIHFLNLNQILKVVILEVAIEVDLNPSIFWMRGCLGISSNHSTIGREI